jgi:5-methylcytosine-specific restriction endonuclease McrA
MSALQKPVLVLNRNWQACHVVPVSRAFTLLWKGVARIIDVEDYQSFSWEDWSQLRPKEGEPVIRSVNAQVRVPEVIALTRYDKLPTKSVTFSRRNIFKRDRGTCQYCGKQPAPDETTIDHVLPRAQGGVSSWANCALACLECNKRKADRTPQQAGMKLKKNPIQPTWKPLYASHHIRLESWAKFVSEVYWNAELEK